MNASFRGWLKITKQNLARRQDEIALGFNNIPTLPYRQMQTGNQDASFDVNNNDEDDRNGGGSQSEEEEDEIGYETVEDVEMEDSNSFISEDLMEEEEDSGEVKSTAKRRQQTIKK